LATPTARAGTLYPSDYEQYLLELVNRGRANPTAEAARFGITLNEGVSIPLDPGPRPPLAFDLHLVESAVGHSRDMLDRDFFGHVSSNGNTAEDRARIAGYRAIAGIGENIAWRGNTLADLELRQAADDMHQALFVDTELPGRGHRLNLLNTEVREVGFGLVAGDWTSGGVTYKSVMITQDFTQSSLSPILTGVVYQDRDHDAFYSPGGEGLGGVSVTARASSGLTLQTKTFPSGGYSLTLIPGAYEVTFAGPSVEETVLQVTVGLANQKLDLIAPLASPWTNPVSSLDINGDGQLAPLDVLVLINEINASGGGVLSPPAGAASPPPYLDPNGDNTLAALDVLLVINALNSPPVAAPQLQA
jgi:hypothetical protein